MADVKLSYNEYSSLIEKLKNLEEENRDLQSGSKVIVKDVIFDDDEINQFVKENEFYSRTQFLEVSIRKLLSRAKRFTKKNFEDVKEECCKTLLDEAELLTESQTIKK